MLRVRMAAEAGANVIVTACPFCMANIEDAIKVAGLEGRMTAIDLAELVDRQIGAGGQMSRRSQSREHAKCQTLGDAEHGDTGLRQASAGPSENEIQLNAAGTDIERDDLVYSVNEADNYAVEEALQIVATDRRQRHCGDGGRRRGRGGPAPRNGHGRAHGRADLRRGVPRLGRPGHRRHPQGLRRDGNITT